MGLSGRFAYADGQWRHDPSPIPPYLVVDIHDSDIATVDYAPPGEGCGRCFLGFEPRIYFEEESANKPLDVRAEGQALAVWARAVTGVAVEPGSVESLLASPDGDDPDDVFVEETVMRLTDLLGLPRPDLADPMRPI